MSNTLHSAIELQLASSIQALFTATAGCREKSGCQVHAFDVGTAIY